MVREDYLTSQSFRTTEEKDNYYAELKTAAESGWDFSSRWFIHEGTNKGNYHFLIASRAMKIEDSLWVSDVGRNNIRVHEYN